MSVLVLLDVDETIINVRYELPVDRDIFVHRMAEAQRNGITVGLNSDSPVANLELYAHEYGILGPIIAERGALYSEGCEAAYSCLNPDACQYSDVLLRFNTRIAEIARDTERYLLLTGNVIGLTNALPALSERVSRAEIAVFTNIFRKCSLGFWVRQRTSTGWGIRQSALEEVRNILCDLMQREFPALYGGCEMLPSDAYGICLVHDRTTLKGSAVNTLMANHKYDTVYMIGDSMSDWLNNSSVTQRAVANASDAYKERCMLVAKAERAAGVLEIIEKIQVG